MYMYHARLHVHPATPRTSGCTWSRKERTELRPWSSVRSGADGTPPEFGTPSSSVPAVAERSAPTRLDTHTTLEVTQGHILSQSPTDATFGRWELTKETIYLHLGCLQCGIACTGACPDWHSRSSYPPDAELDLAQFDQEVLHPGGNPGAYLKSISHRCHLR